MSVDLRTFVKQALTEMILGVADAQEAVKDTTARLNPAEIIGGPRRAFTGARRPVQDVEFDVAVTATEGGGMNAGIRVLALQIGANDKSQTSIASRIKFSVPIVFPLHPENEKAISERLARQREKAALEAKPSDPVRQPGQVS